MYECRTLIERYWLDRQTDKELYHQARRDLPKYRRFITEQLGWRIIQNERIIKVEKTPAAAERFMGINTFVDKRDYCLLCALLIYLDDKEDDEPFLLSEMVTFISEQLRQYMEIDWKDFSQRKSLIRVLQFAETMKFLIAHEGKSENLSGGMEQEVLYENTGLSRYFATNFGYDISGFKGYSDFDDYMPEEASGDRGHFRINRVYRKLVSSPALYWQDVNDADALYLKNQRQWVEKNLQEQLGGQLHVHRNCAFFVLDEEHTFGRRHPRDAMLPQLVLLLCGLIYDWVQEGRLVRDEYELIHMTATQFDDLVTQCRDKYGAGWSKEYRDMPEEKLSASVLDYMTEWLLAAVEEDRVILYPSVAKLRGEYNGDFSPDGDSKPTAPEPIVQEDSLF